MMKAMKAMKAMKKKLAVLDEAYGSDRLTD